jgi:hypothetical protein
MFCNSLRQATAANRAKMRRSLNGCFSRLVLPFRSDTYLLVLVPMDIVFKLLDDELLILNHTLHHIAD